jgi:hypothetical protein
MWMDTYPPLRKSHALLGQVAEGNNHHTGYIPQSDYTPTTAESDDFDACMEALNAYTYNNGSKPLTIPQEVYCQMAMYSPAGLALILADREAFLKANPNLAPYPTSPYPSRTNTYIVQQGQPYQYDIRAPTTQQRPYPTTTPLSNRYPTIEATRVATPPGGVASTPTPAPAFGPALTQQRTRQQLPKQYTKNNNANSQANLLPTGDQILA